jgi:hypothetical protein
MLFCMFATTDGKPCKIYDCENRHPEQFCPASNRPWSPSGDPAKPVPCPAPELWTTNVQHVWQDVVKSRQLYTPPYPSLPYTTDKKKPYEMPGTPEPYVIRVRAPNKGEERCISPSSDHGNRQNFSSAAGQVDAEDIGEVLASSPPKKLRVSEHNLVCKDRDERVGLYGAMEKSSIKTRIITRLEEISEEEPEDELQEEMENLEVVAATEADLKYFKEDCFERGGVWMKHREK